MEKKYYTTSLEHILAELERIDLLIQAQVHRAREVYQGDSTFQGLYISEHEVDTLLSKPTGLPQWANFHQSKFHIHDALEQITADIKERERESVNRGITLRLSELARQFQLSPFEIDVLLICLAPELDLRYERLYAYLQDDITKKRPSVDLVLNLLCPSFDEKVSARRYFIQNAPLITQCLVSLFEDPSHQASPLLSQYLKLDRRLVDYLLGSDDLCDALMAYARLVSPKSGLNALILPQEVKDQLVRLGRMYNEGTVFYIYGPYGVGKQETAEALCQHKGIQMLIIDGPMLLATKDLEIEKTIRLIGRELRLHHAALYWDGFNTLLAEEKHAERNQLLNAIETWRVPVFLGSDRLWEPAGVFKDTLFVRIELSLPDYEQRVTLWKHQLNGSNGVSEFDLQGLAGAFRLSGGQISDAITTARNLAYAHNPEAPEIRLQYLNPACRLHSNQKLSELAQKITPRYCWDDIVLPKEQLTQLHEIYNAVRYRPVVYQKWGFDRKLSLGKGLNILFSGPSGTGKTMAADIIANELGLDLYKIDLSAVVSKYIGETEKNLAKIFGEAATSNAILFFDEADALFGKRSEVKDSHDRYANIETGYLLQKMEEYDGVVILATNLRNNLDDAFARRMAFTVSFPFPEEEDRQRIWEGIWPAETPRASDLDLTFMARQFRLAGGNIKNIALGAAFLAADDGRSVTMDQLIRATKREFQKMGKICVKTDFGAYYDLVA